MTAHLGPTFVIVMVEEAAASALRAREFTPDVAALVEVAARLGVELRPIHESSEGAALATHFYAAVDDPARADAVAAELHSCEVVTGAYVQPAASTPDA